VDEFFIVDHGTHPPVLLSEVQEVQVIEAKQMEQNGFGHSSGPSAAAIRMDCTRVQEHHFFDHPPLLKLRLLTFHYLVQGLLMRGISFLVKRGGAESEAALRGGEFSPVVSAREQVPVCVERHDDRACPSLACTTLVGNSSPPSILRLMHHDA
jgi:hypothetical protein